MSEAIVLKIAKGAFPPSGFQKIREMRTHDIYHKIVPKITKNDLDDLSSIFDNMNMDVAIVKQENEEDTLNRMMGEMNMGGMNMGGGRRMKGKSRKYRKYRKHRKTRRYRK